MTRKQRLTMKMLAKELPFEVIVKSIAKGITLLFINPEHPNTSQRKREMVMLKRELKSRGFTLIPHPMPLGVVMELLPAPVICLSLPDYHAMADCSMLIPSVDFIINAPLPTDLPAHGYLHA
jgi:hypothetical protein